MQESAEAIVATSSRRREGPNNQSQPAPPSAMHEPDADKQAAMPGPPARAGDGIAEGSGLARPTCAGRTEQAGDEALRLMDKVVSRENMLLAHRRVVQNKGTAGADGMSVGELWEFCRQHWPAIRERLLNGTYVPQPVRKVEIPKASGNGTRTLGIPTVLDRLIQQAMLQVLSPIFDPTFSDGSFGFRPGRSAHDAVRSARRYMAAGHRWVVDMDLEKFFDRVNHDILMGLVSTKVR